MADYGVDVSIHNGVVPWTDLKNNGISFAICRAGYGKGNLDETFITNVQNATAAGIKCGAYWFMYANTIGEAKREGEYCRKIIEDSGVLLELPVFADQEDSDWRRRYGCDYSKLTEQTIAFKEGLGNLNFGVYANLHWFSAYLDTSRFDSNWKIWLAQYTTKESPDMACDIWQYSDKYEFLGKTYDINIMNM